MFPLFCPTPVFAIETSTLFDVETNNVLDIGISNLFGTDTDTSNF